MQEFTDVLKIEDIYGIINHVQTTTKKCSFVASILDAFTIENILRDADLEFTKSNHINGINFILHPPKIKPPDDDFHIDEILDDEIQEDGQCF